MELKEKPCPWCGKNKFSVANWGTGKNDRDHSDEWFKFSVYCSNKACGVVGPHARDEKAAVTKWNKIKREK